MKLKDRIKTYNFWVSLSSAIFLLLKVLGNQFGFNVNESLFSDLITSLCGILVILGIIVPPTTKTVTDSVPLNNLNINQEKSDCKEENETNQSFAEENTIECLPESEITNPEEIDGFSSENKISSEEFFSSPQTDELTLEDADNLNHDDHLINELNINEIKSQVSKTLLNQEKLFEGNTSVYIELLQNQINILQNK